MGDHSHMHEGRRDNQVRRQIARVIIREQGSLRHSAGESRAPIAAFFHLPCKEHASALSQLPCNLQQIVTRRHVKPAVLPTIQRRPSLSRCLPLQCPQSPCRQTQPPPPHLHLRITCQHCSNLPWVGSTNLLSQEDGTDENESQR